MKFECKSQPFPNVKLLCVFENYRRKGGQLRARCRTCRRIIYETPEERKLRQEIQRQSTCVHKFTFCATDSLCYCDSCGVKVFPEYARGYEDGLLAGDEE